MSKTVKIGNLKIGGKNPVRIKGMLKSSTKDKKNLIKEAKLLEAEGAEAIRVAVREFEDAKVYSLLRKHISVPLVADIHFHHFLALEAIKEGFESIRLNPLNIAKKKEVEQVAKLAKKHKVSIRVGINSGGFKKTFSTPKDMARAMVKKVESYLKVLEGVKFFDIMVSLKGADVRTTILANEFFSAKHSYPLHLGVTATGALLEGLTKSSIGLGNLLYKGIGDVIRVSLTAPSYLEIRAAKDILTALDIRRFGPQVISCPTCSRCEVNLIDIVDKLKKTLKKEKITRPLTIAVMGCVVNGPGEAQQADIGVAFGKEKAAIFKKEKILKKSDNKKIVSDLIKKVREL